MIGRAASAFVFLLLIRFYWIIPTNRTYEFLRVHLADPQTVKSPLVILKTHARLLMPFEYLLLLLALGLVIYLISLEVRHKALSGLCEKIRGSTRWAQAAVTYGFVFSAAPYLSPGMPYRRDSIFHLLSAWYLDQNLQAGAFSLFTNSVWSGYAYTRRYGPFLSAITGLGGWVLKNWLLAFKLLLAAFHIASGWAMFLYVFRKTKNRMAGFISALAYGFIYFRYHWLVNMGRLRYGIHLAAFPLIGYLADQYLEKRRPREIVLLGLLFSVLVLTQPGPTTGFTFLLLNLYVFGLTAFGKEPLAEKARIFLGLNALVLIPAVLAGWVIGPDMVAKLGHVLVFKKPGLPPPELATLVTWGPVPVPNPYGSYLGWSILLIAGTGVLRAILKKDRWALTIFFLGLFTFFLVFGKDAPGYSRIPWIYSVNSPGYFLLFSIFFIAVLCGYGVLFFDRGPRGEKRDLAVLAIVAFIVLDLGPLTFQDSFSDRAPHGRQDAYDWLKKQQEKSSRAIDLGDELAYNAVFLPIYTGFPAANGPDFAVDRPPTRDTIHNLIYVLRDQNLLRDERNIALLKKTLFLMNIEYLMMPSEFLAPLFREVVSFGQGPAVGRLRPPAIALASKRIEPFQPDGRPAARMLWNLNLIDASGVDDDRGTLETIFLDPSRPGAAQETAGHEPLVFQVSKTRIKPAELEIEYSLNQKAFLHIAAAYYPYLEVTLDGKKTGSIYKTALGFLAVPSPAGSHALKVKPAMTFPDKVWFFAASFVLLGCLWALFRGRRREDPNLTSLISGEPGMR